MSVQGGLGDRDDDPVYTDWQGRFCSRWVYALAPKLTISAGCDLLIVPGDEVGGREVFVLERKPR